MLRKIGMLYNGPPFQHPYERPISIRPCPGTAGHILLPLHQSKQKNSIHLLAPLSESGTEVDLQGKQIHQGHHPLGSDGVFISTWQRQLKDQYLAVADENIILVNYRRRLPRPFLEQSKCSRCRGSNLEAH
ncbi:hypothetical protein CEXT_368381 [Caerostris extrusa]|uniref:Uncharacterized protein n=1 Tax=Caerostris extrusa TaxID=172846 RepID=A0AAV4VSX9_CAEEX|nr:hypothetical protein CEXT_368381 [Caerostris extrusa]